MYWFVKGSCLQQEPVRLLLYSLPLIWVIALKVERGRGKDGLQWSVWLEFVLNLPSSAEREGCVTLILAACLGSDTTAAQRWHVSKTPKLAGARNFPSEHLYLLSEVKPLDKLCSLPLVYLNCAQDAQTFVLALAEVAFAWETWESSLGKGLKEGIKLGVSCNSARE